MDATPFDIVGRDEALVTVTGRVRAGTVVSVLGPGGIGKTTLLRAWADGRDVRWVDLEGVSTVDVALTRICAASRVSTRGAEDRDALVARLGEVAPHAVLLLDGLEHLAEQAGAVFRDWLVRSGQCAIATSRVRLGIPEESEVPLGPLAPADAIALLCRAAERRGATVSAHPDLPALVAALDHHPLALELAAPWLRVLSVPELRRRLDDRFELLRQRGDGANPRHTSMEAVLDASWALLDEHDRCAMQQLCTTAGSFDMEAAEAIWEGPGSALERVARLVDRSWVQSLHYGRMQLADTVRAYVMRRAPPDDAARLRHATWFATAGARWEEWLYGADTRTWLDRLRWELPNLLQAADAVGELDPDLAAQCVAASVPVLPRVGYGTQMRWLDRAAAWVKQPHTRVRVLHGRASALTWWGYPALAEAALVEASEHVQTPLQRLSNMASRGEAALDQGDHERAWALHRAAVEVARDPELRAWLPLALADAGASAKRLGHVDDATALLEEVVQRQSETPSTVAHMDALTLLSELALPVDPSRARDLGARSYALTVEHGTGRHRAEAAVAWGRALAALGDRAKGHAVVRQEVDRDPKLAPAVLARLHEWADRLSAPPTTSVVLGNDGAWVEIDGMRHDLRRRGPARRILWALWEAESPLATATLFEAGWPGECVSHEVMTNRVYVTVGKLRALGLGQRLRTTDGGYDLVVDAR